MVACKVAAGISLKRFDVWITAEVDTSRCLP